MTNDPNNPELRNLRAKVQRLDAQFTEDQELIGRIKKARAKKVAELSIAEHERDAARADNARLTAEVAAVKELADKLADWMRTAPVVGMLAYQGRHEFIEQRAALLAEYAATPTGQDLLEDKARVAWLEVTPVVITVPMHEYPTFHIFSDAGDGEGPTLRAAIDAARSRERVGEATE
jgi:hypothetical protein